MGTSKSYEVDYQLAAEAMAEAFTKLMDSNSGIAAEDAASTEWEDLKEIFRDYAAAITKHKQIARSPWLASLSDPDLRFQKKV